MAKVKMCMAAVHKSQEDDCAFNFANEVISPKWNVNIILEFITEGSTLSFSEIADRIPEISPRMLSMRLKFLIEKNLIHIIPNENKPKKIKYYLSNGGLRLANVLRTIREWSLEFGDCKNERCVANECRHGLAISQLIQLQTQN